MPARSLLAFLATALTSATLASAQQPPERDTTTGPNTRSGALSAQLLRNVRFRGIGPANTSGRVTAVDVVNAPGHKTIYVGFASGGVWKTTNNGTTWSPVFDDAATANIGDLAIAPSNPSVIWV
ncbi:MAG TPA: hypothetical protein VF021_10590, partial [Longimicrobiales bacterium]